MSVQAGEGDNQNVGKALVELGWRQGVLISSTRLLEATSGDDLQTFASLSPETKLVVVSQTCDIVISPETESVVEALVCDIDAQRATSGLGNSSRYFTIDPASSLVAYASKRVLIAKPVLLALQPDDWSWDEDRRSLFVHWLADRWRRPEFPNAFVDCFGKPLRDAIKKAKKRDDPVWAILKREVYQFRAGCGPEQPGTPLVISIYALVKPGATATDLLAVREFISPVIDQANATDGNLIKVNRLRITRPDQFSLADAWKIRPIDFDFLSTDGDEVGLLGDGPD